MDDHTIFVSGGDNYDEEMLMLIFESKRNGGGDIDEIQNLGNGSVKITFVDAAVAAALIEKSTLNTSGMTLKISADSPSDPGPENKLEDELVADSLPQDSNRQLFIEADDPLPSDELLFMYFENKRVSGGGDVEEIIRHNDTRSATIIFKEKEAINNVLKRSNHRINLIELKVRVLEQLPELDDVRSCTIEVTDVPSNSSDDLLLMFFENRRSGGGDVENVYYDQKNGKAFVTFQSAEVALRVSKQQSLKLDGNTFQVRLMTPMPPPPQIVGDIDKRKLLVAHLPPHFDDKDLEHFFKEAAGKDVVKISRSQNPSVAIITFSDSPDYIGCRRLVIRKPFKDRMISIQRLPVCTQVIAFPIPHDLSDDVVQLHFESPRFGGSPTINSRFYRENKYAVFTDNDRSVINKIMQNSHVIRGHSLSVDYFYEDFGPPFALATSSSQPTGATNDEDSCSLPIEADDVKIPCDPRVIHFMTTNIELKKQIELELCAHHSEVIWPANASDGQILVRLTPSTVESKETFSAETWTKTSTNLIENQIERIKADRLKVDAELWPDFVTQLSKDAPKDMILDKSDNELCVYFVGFKNSVEKFRLVADQLMETLHEIRKQENESVTELDEDLTSVQLQLVQMSDFIQHSKKTGVEITIDDKVVKYFGRRCEVSVVRKNLRKVISAFKSRSLSATAAKYEAFQGENARKYVERLLNEKGIRVILEVNENNILLHGLTKASIEAASNLLNSDFEEKELPLNNDSILVLTMPQWTTALGKLQSKYPVMSAVVSDNQDSLVCCSRKSELAEVIGAIEVLIKSYASSEQFLTVSKSTVEYIDRYLSNKINAIQNDLSGSNVSISTRVSELPAGIRISGSVNGVDQALEKMKALADSIVSRDYTTDARAVKKAIKERRGKDFIVALEARNKLIIKTSESCGATGSAAVDGQTPVKEVEEFVIKLKCALPSNLEVNIAKGKILKCKADILVNPSNPSLDCTGELSKLIIEKGGSSIADECKQHVRGEGALLECQMFASAAGNLAFKTIIHTVGPAWKSGQSQEIEYLSDFVVNILKESVHLNLESIALPLIVDVAEKGFPPSSATYAIIEGIREFSDNIRNPSCLKTINLVVESDQMIKHFIKAASEILGESSICSEIDFIRSLKTETRGAAKASQSSPRSDNRGLSIDSHSNTVTTAQGIKIQMIFGAIAAQKTDVIVNTTTSDMKFSSGAVSKSILEAAGPEIEKECRTKSSGGNLHPGKVVITRPFNLKCKAVFHVACMRWDGEGKVCEKTTREMLQRVFETASQKNYISVALPAIGSGMLGVPRLKVATMMYEEAIDFCKRVPNSKLRNIYFVIYDKDEESKKVFQRHLSSFFSTTNDSTSTPQAPMRRTRQMMKEGQMKATANAKESSSHGRSPELPEKSFGDVAVKMISPKGLIFEDLVELAVVTGDITKQTTDAIVNCTNQSLNLNLGAVSCAIAKGGGDAVVQECKKLGKLTNGVAVTQGGNLRCKKIIHLGAADEGGDWAAVIRRGLRETERLKFNSISFPLLGTGERGIDPTFMSSQFLAAVSEFVSNDKPRHVKRIFVVIYQRDLVDTFADALIQTAAPSPPAPKRHDIRPSDDQLDVGEASVSGNWDLLLKPGSADRIANYSLTFNIIAQSQQDIEAAIKEIDEFGRESIRDVVLDSAEQQKVIAALTQLQLDRIEAIQRSLEVKIKIERQKTINRIRIRGDSNDVATAITKITDIFHESDRLVRQEMEAKLIAKEAQWEFLEENGGYEPYPADINKIIEMAFKEKKQFARWEELDGTFQLDFTAMIETKEGDHDSQVKVKRSGNVVIKYPVWWEQAENINSLMELKRLTLGSAELLTVENRIQQTCGETVSEIISVERIQNPTLYKQYVAKKELMEVVYANSRNVEIERHLWHGTSEEVARDICRYGFNRSYSGNNAGTLHGKGAYFANQWAYSAREQYSKPNADGVKFIILSTVLTGEFAKSNKDLIDAPLKSETPKVKYDSVVDDVANPVIFVVFSDHQAYPEYLIQFYEKAKTPAT